jgi:hypothetical protein
MTADRSVGICALTAWLTSIARATSVGRNTAPMNGVRRQTLPAGRGQTPGRSAVVAPVQDEYGDSDPRKHAATQ